MEPDAIRIREVTPSDQGAVEALLTEYVGWVNERVSEELGLEPVVDAAAVAASVPALRRPSGLVLVAERSRELVGTGTLRWLPGGAAEVKRMYVAPSARSLRLGSALLDALIAEADGGGATAIRLDTIRFMVDAQRLYASRGFVERGPYEGTDIPTHLYRHWLFFERPARPG